MIAGNYRDTSHNIADEQFSLNVVVDFQEIIDNFNIFLKKTKTFIQKTGVEV